VFLQDAGAPLDGDIAVPSPFRINEEPRPLGANAEAVCFGAEDEEVLLFFELGGRFLKVIPDFLTFFYGTAVGP
jgi:hypothetical protein